MAEPALSDYRAKRKFDATPEPAGDAPKAGEAEPDKNGNRWVIQQHAATRMHYDFRLEADGVLISWAVPKRAFVRPGRKRLAVHVEDHPLDYRQFEGLSRGAITGRVRLSFGTKVPTATSPSDGHSRARTRSCRIRGHVSVWLEGSKLVGGWSLTRFGPEDQVLDNG